MKSQAEPSLDAASRWWTTRLINIEPGVMTLSRPSNPLLPVLGFMVLTPLAIILGWSDFTKGRSVATRGFLAGLILGLWSLSCAIVIPYLGLYPVAWSAFIHAFFFGWTNHGLSFWVTLYVLNLVGCPLTGMLFFRRMDRWRQRLIEQAK